MAYRLITPTTEVMSEVKLLFTESAVGFFAAKTPMTLKTAMTTAWYAAVVPGSRTTKKPISRTATDTSCKMATLSCAGE